MMGMKRAAGAFVAAGLMLGTAACGSEMAKAAPPAGPTSTTIKITPMGGAPGAPQSTPTQSSSTTAAIRPTAAPSTGPAWPGKPVVRVGNNVGWHRNAPAGDALASFPRLFWQLLPEDNDPSTSRGFEEIPYIALGDKAPFLLTDIPACEYTTGGHLYPLTGGGALLECSSYPFASPEASVLLSADGSQILQVGTTQEVAAAADGSAFAVLDASGTSVSIRDPRGTEIRRLTVPASERVAWTGATLVVSRYSGETGERVSTYIDPETGAVLTALKPEVIGGVTWTQRVSAGQVCLLANRKPVFCTASRDNSTLTLVPSPSSTHLAVLSGDAAVATITPATRSVFALPSRALFAGWESDEAIIMEELQGTVQNPDGSTEFLQEPYIVRVAVEARSAELAPSDLTFFAWAE